MGFYRWIGLPAVSLGRYGVGSMDLPTSVAENQDLDAREDWRLYAIALALASGCCEEGAPVV